MRIVRVSPVVLAAVAVVAMVLPADANPMGRGGGGGGGGGIGLGGIGAAIGTAVVVGGIVSAMDDAARRRDEAVQNGLEAGRAAGRKPISEVDYDRKMNEGLTRLRSKNKGKNIDDSVFQNAVIKYMNEKYTIAKPAKYDNDAVLEQQKIDRRETIRIKSGGRQAQPGHEANDPNRIKKSGLKQKEHDLLYKPGTEMTGDEF